MELIYFFAIVLLIILICILYYSICCIEFHLYLRYIYFDNIKSYDKKYRNICRVKTKDHRKVIISMTTIPKRINKIKATLMSLLNQSRRVDKIYINIPYKTLKGETYKIPSWLKNLRNVNIRRIKKDWGPSSKLLPSLIREDHDTIIIVVDDDVIYGSKIVETYVNSFYKRGCKDVITNFGSRVTNKLHLDDSEGFVPPPHLRIFSKPGYSDVVYGHHSFLVTPKMFSKTKEGDFKNTRIFEYDRAPDNCRWVDDIWFSGWLLYNHIKIWSIGFVNRTVAISNILTTDTPSLCHNQNVNDKNNNTCIKWFRQRKEVNYITFK